MRFADGPSTQVEVRVSAPPEVLWRLVTDIDLPGRFSEEFQGAEWVDGAHGAAVGARFRGRNEHRSIGQWETTSIVFVCDTNSAFGWKVSDVEKPAATWRFDLEPTADGTATTLRQSVQLGPGRSGLTIVLDQRPDMEERIIERRLAEHQRNMTATVEGIKTLAETT